MSDLENVLRRLARLLQSEEASDGAQVADDPEPDRSSEVDRPADGPTADSARDLPHRGAAAT